MKTTPLMLALILLGACALVACGGGSTTTTTTSPTITGIEPVSGAVAGGTAITIHGTGLANATVGANDVLIGGNPATNVVVHSDTMITCVAPGGVLGPCDVAVTKNAGTAVLPGGYTFYPAPTLTSITPDNGVRFGGEEVTLKGTGFLENNPLETVFLIDLKPIEDVVIVDDETAVGTTPSSYLERPKDVVVVNNNGEATLPLAYTYTGPPPLILSVDPDRTLWTAVSTPVTIKGEWFTVAGLPIIVTFGAKEASNVVRVDDFTLTCVAPQGAPGEWVTVTTANANGSTSLIGDPVAETGFYYVPPPTVYTVTPDEGSVDGGTSVTIEGMGFLSGGDNAVLFGGIPATGVTVVDDHTLTCVVPPSSVLGAVDIQVTNDAGGGTLEDAFTYTPPDFWWEDTLGTAFSTTGDDPMQAVSIPYQFPFYDQTWDSVYVSANGHIDFGSSANASYSVAPNLLSCAHISPFGCDCYLYTTDNVWYTSHIPGRTIITFNGVGEFIGAGANFVQIHLHQSGVFAILYKSITFKHSSGFSSSARVAVNPGGGTSVTVDWTSGVTGAGPNDAINQVFTSQADLGGGYLMLYKNSNDGYDCQFINGIPSDPN